MPDYKNEEFDSYVSNMSLHQMPDPAKMLAEAFRVLKKGGNIGVSAWGRKENCTFLTLRGKVLEKYAIKEDFRSNFHLSEKETVVDLLEKAGFKDVLVWYQSRPIALN